mmetsp:Transcript_9805/g.19848  ORF Transcript_9805/g.19848 Transcript_9805/m.19848 type:complete len:260 (-) Transcript_9805:95-874(-)
MVEAAVGDGGDADILLHGRSHHLALAWSFDTLSSLPAEFQHPCQCPRAVLVTCFTAAFVRSHAVGGVVCALLCRSCPLHRRRLRTQSPPDGNSAGGDGCTEQRWQHPGRVLQGIWEHADVADGVHHLVLGLVNGLRPRTQSLHHLQCRPKCRANSAFCLLDCVLLNILFGSVVVRDRAKSVRSKRESSPSVWRSTKDTWTRAVRERASREPRPRTWVTVLAELSMVSRTEVFLTLRMAGSVTDRRKASSWCMGFRNRQT